MSSRFFTNKEGNSLFDKFKGVFENNPSIQEFDALVGYFRSSGYFALRPYLEGIPKIRILVGINVDSLIKRANSQAIEFRANKKDTKNTLIKDLQKDIQDASYQEDIEKGIVQFIDDVVSGKLEIKAHPSKNIHAKIYIFRPENFNEHTPASVITGSSNFTSQGLGSSSEHNYEFNVLLNQYEDIRFATDEFEELWKESVTLLEEDMQTIKKNTYLNDEITPYELYIKLLIEYFGKDIDYDPESIGDLPTGFKRLSYQMDAVTQGYNMLMAHNGFFLADVVGLGKTVIAALIAKKFIIEHGFNRAKILVVFPPAVEDNWKDTFRKFQIDSRTKFITNGRLSHIINQSNTDYWPEEEYDLVIVDESHKYRNTNTEAFKNLQRICKGRTNKGERKKVIMVSATPLNNRPDDIFNQLLMFQDARRSTLPKSNLTNFFAPLTRKYNELRKNPDRAETTKEIRKIYKEIRKYITEPITVRRTRNDLRSSDRYKEDLNKQGIVFPEVNAPKPLYYMMDAKLSKLFEDTIDCLTEPDKLSYARYRAIEALHPEIGEEIYERAAMVSNQLAFIMKTMLVKRLESSFTAFKTSINSLHKSIDRMIEMFDRDRVIIAPDFNVNEMLDKGLSFEEIEEIIEKETEKENSKNNIFAANDFREDFIDELKHDKEIIAKLCKDWKEIDYDPKLDEFFVSLKKEILSKDKNPSGKLVIFTEAETTALYLERELKDKGYTDVLAISSANRKRSFRTIMENFDANHPKHEQKNDYNIIVTTEVLAEGVNLHRSNTVLHYDTPWNSTKLMQRIGRVNRIGTTAEEIYNYVFYPSEQGDSEIGLSNLAFNKIQAFHAAFGEDNQIYSEEEELSEKGMFLLEEPKEELDERIQYLHFIRDFKKNNKKEYKRIKNIPEKSRVCRKPIDKDIAGSSIVFLRSDKRLDFYEVNKDGVVGEITDIEAIKRFEAEMDERPYTLIKKHFDHVQLCIQRFDKEEIEFVQQENLREVLPTLDLKAINTLKPLEKYSKGVQRKIIQNLIEHIRIGTYAGLSKDINKIKTSGGADQALKEVNKVADYYGIGNERVEEKKKESDRAKLIISESFLEIDNQELKA